MALTYPPLTNIQARCGRGVERAIDCLQLANEATDAYVRVELTDLAAELRQKAETFVRRGRQSQERMLRHPPVPSERYLPGSVGVGTQHEEHS
jgi:hypothetical protein